MMDEKIDNKALQEQHEGENASTLVTWSTPQDPDNPLQWPIWKKWTNVILISLQGTLTPLTSTLPAVAAEAIAKDLKTSSSISPALPVAMFVLGLGVGPLYLAPLSERFGRRIVYLISFTSFAFINIGCARAPNLAALAVFRFLSGMAGSAGPSLGGASIGDLFVKAERGKAQALYSLGPTFGPVLGGVLGGFILYGTGSWRWNMWATVIAPGIFVVFNVLLLRETYAPYLLRCRASRMRREYPGQAFHTEYDDTDVRGALLLSSTRPLRMLVTSPICASLAFYIAIVYGIFYLHMLSLSLLFGPDPVYGLYTYRWNNGTTGLSYLGVGTGILFGTFLSSKYSGRVYQWRKAVMTQKAIDAAATKDAINAEQHLQVDDQPEARLFLLQVGMIIIPLGLIMYAWTASRTHWIVPLLGASIFATGMIIAWVAFQTYMVDVFGRFAASALATATILRSLLGCVLSMFGFGLYRNLNYGWGTMILAFLCLAMIPLPYLLTKFGPRLRKKKFTY